MGAGEGSPLSAPIGTCSAALLVGGSAAAVRLPPAGRPPNAASCIRINETTWFNPQQNFNGASRVLSAFHFGSSKIWYFVHLFLRRLTGLTKDLLRWVGWGLVCSIGPMNLLCFFAALRGQAGCVSSRRAKRGVGLERRQTLFSQTLCGMRWPPSEGSLRSGILRHCQFCLFLDGLPPSRSAQNSAGFQTLDRPHVLQLRVAFW